MRAREGWVNKHYSLNYDPFTPQKIVRSKKSRSTNIKTTNLTTNPVIQRGKHSAKKALF